MVILAKASITLYSIILILGIIGNGLVIWIAGFRMKKTISAVWFLHLAITDLLCCLSLPLLIVHWASGTLCSSSPSSEIFCTLYRLLLNINMSASVFFLTAMSVDRWVSVMWPFWAKIHRTQKLVRITAGIIWVMSFIWIGLIFYFSVFYVHDDSYDIELIIDLTRLVVLFVIPFIIIFTSYVTIAFKLKKSKRPQRSQRPYRIITAVILCFFICWFPYLLRPLIARCFISSDGILRYLAFSSVFLILACLNSCINPIIYVFMANDFRHGFLRSIPFRLEKALSEPPNEPYEEEDHELSPTSHV
ncbi:hypothetical protein GDO81_014699 [Engystomops pustulosus]|uniref:G-protein coupled receptors family 1 profile domain-containing protein n=1 Tax=Engystomops pustulosus TaxID=76066 RepID=A0AAV7BCC3_ENGPU|nr:hypothetical protein GDO81_014699 [Engystomops pustulosus]